LRNILVKWEPVLRGFALEETRIFNDNTLDGQYRASALRGPNAFWQQHEGALAAIATALETEWLRGYHCTRLTDSEAAQIASRGMTLPTEIMLKARVGHIYQDSMITKIIADRLIGKNQADEKCRANRICFIFTQNLLKEENGVGDFFRYWGGESLYNCHDNDAEISPILQSIGEPRIIVAAVPVSGLHQRRTLSEIISRLFIESRDGHAFNSHGYADWIELDVPKGHIKQIIGRQDSLFEKFTGCSTWRRTLQEIKSVRPPLEAPRPRVSSSAGHTTP
jgi:hypothetical protein